MGESSRTADHNAGPSQPRSWHSRMPISTSSSQPGSFRDERDAFPHSKLQHLHSFSSACSVGIEAFSGPSATLNIQKRGRQVSECRGGASNALSRSRSRNDRDNEHTPLLLQRQVTPLPKKVMTVLCIVLFCEPVSMTILFPFIYFMVRDFGLASDKEVGYYVGFIASSFSLAQFLTSLLWGWLSDRIGRRPVLLIGLLGNAISLILFGQSHTLQMAIFSRMLCGILNGNVGIAKCVIGEVTDETNQSLGFSLIGIMWSLGTIFGPIVGGCLSEPVKQFPGWFGGCPFLKANPYFLPCFLSACVSLIGFVVGLLFLEETNEKVKAGRRLAETEIEDGDLRTASDIHQPAVFASVTNLRPLSADSLEIEDSATRTSSQETLQAYTELPASRFEAKSIIAIGAYAMFSFQNIILEEVFSLWVVSPPEDGGLGYTPSDVGICLSILGFVALYFQLVLYPSMSRSSNPVTLFQTGSVLCIVPYLIIFIIINNSAADGNLGLVNGVAQTSAAFVRSIGPVLGGIMWAWSITNGRSFPFNYWFVFVLLAVWAVGTIFQARYLSDDGNDMDSDEVTVTNVAAASEANESPISRITVTDLFLRMNSFTSTSTLGIEAFSGPAVLSTQQHPSDVDLRHTDATVEATVHPVQATPLPVNIITSLSFVIICEPLSLTVLFPFIYFMVRDFGISDDKEVGFYVGFIASSFSLAQFCTSLCWGWISERTGRKPVLLIGLIGNAISLLLFGQAHTLQAAIASRMLCGMLNGNVGICKCIIGEVTDSTNQSEGFSLINIMWSLGTIFGPMIGGLLANPVETYPGVFGSCAFLKENPYFLPCFVSALVSFTGFIVTAFLLEETNPNMKCIGRGVVAAENEEQFSQPLNREHCFSAAKLRPQLISAVSTDETVLGASRGASSSALVIEEATESTPLLSTAGAVSRNSALGAASILAITGYTMLAFQTIILDEVFNLWVVTPREDGGLGYSSADVGISLSLISFIALYFQLRTYPFLVRFRTPLSLFRIGLALYIPPYLMHPIISGIIAPNCSTTFTYACLIINLAFLQFSNILCFTSIFIVINNSVSASNKQQLSTVTGIAQTCAAFVRSIGPALGGVLWAWSITNGMAFPFNYWFVFLAIAGMGVGTWLQAQWIPEC
ncbi:hypothetical protein CcCBS67573_g10201 [Chytriomyces confervae]|uniref:Major facilitator superfamily (MFS) profile domain-containing protein n=1 Tax=Chytriomyces confervae TaxID=246404 RepID=A0A507DA04_9FUNG|nr:hypothetical protein CcCBS67573_g10201 [Chytriomyces confervae]